MGPRPEYPRPALRRAEWQSLNGEWEFGAGDEPVFDRRIVVPFCPESELSGIGRRAGDVVWYRRWFDAPEAERLHLHFGAVDYRATVWVNDVEVARHEGGHSPFTADVTAAARTGENVGRRGTPTRPASTASRRGWARTGSKPTSACAPWRPGTGGSGSTASPSSSAWSWTRVTSQAAC